MPLDPNIYQNIDPNFGLKLGSIFDPAARQKREDESRLANLASIGQEAQLRQNLQQLKAAPMLQQRAEQERMLAQKQKNSQELDMFIANSIASGVPKEQVLMTAAQKAKAYGFSEDEAKMGLGPLMTLQDPKQIHQHYLTSAMPEEAGKLKLQQMFTKQKPEDVLGERKIRLAEKELEWKMGQGPKKTPLSATAQKELFEAEDIATSSENVISLLEEAKKLNSKAYSGYGAKTRAVVRSNIPGESEAADATIALDNLMTGQALESLKSTFGGMPTEGERKILLEIQASAEKTPKQRLEIMERAQKAAQNRMIANRKKAEKLRSGEYFSETQQESSVNVDSLLEKYK